MVKKNKLEDIIGVVKKLRNPKKGCPWDIEQTSKSLSKYTLEEAYEVVEAIEKGNFNELEDELGDLLLQVIYHSVIAEEKKKFTINNVIEKSVEKMKLRHPHIFLKDNSIKSIQDVNNFWEYQKKIERKKKGSNSALDGVSTSLPAVTRSLKLQKRASKEGFDWNNAQDTLKKVKEELSELTTEMKGNNKKRIKEELGDLLFSIINLSRHLEIDASEAINQANHKFVKRFTLMEENIAKDNQEIGNLTSDELEEFWVKIKSHG